MQTQANTSTNSEWTRKVKDSVHFLGKDCISCSSGIHLCVKIYGLKHILCDSLDHTTASMMNIFLVGYLLQFWVCLVLQLNFGFFGGGSRTEGRSEGMGNEREWEAKYEIHKELIQRFWNKISCKAHYH